MILKKNLLLFSLLFISLTSFSKVFKVESLNDNGPGTLRDYISVAASGDTILMNIKGVINLASTINITKKLYLLGAFPIHTEINGSAIVSGAAIQITAASVDTVFIEGFRFTNCGGNVGAVFVSANGSAVVKSCVFKNNSGSAFGQAITVATNSTAIIVNSSFINNTTSSQGGAISLNSGSSQAFIRNCTFNLNSAPSNGGAINNTGDLSVGNCTFLNNNCPSGADIRNSGGTIEIYNNIFSNSTPGSQLASSVGLWNNQGGNVYSGNSISYSAIVGVIGTDIFSGSQANIQLSSTPTIDGYGLEYFRIALQTSPCVDNGVLSGQVLQTDCRRAPRQIYGDNALLPDAGAVEFTPHTVTGNTPATFLAKWVAMDGSVFPGPRYMDFDITGGGPVNFNMSSTLSSSNISVHYMVDGFTQNGSIVAGPGNAPNSYTPATYMINIINNVADVFSFSNPGSLSFIAGLNIDNANGFVGIPVNDGGIHIYGNHLVSTSLTGAVGILLTGINNATIGGPLHHHRNVIGNQVNAGVHSQNDQTNFQGNFIGTNATGTGSLANNKGILSQANSVMIFGKYRFPSMNLISGNSTAQIEIASGSFVIRGNIIGPQVDGNTTMAATARGIEAGPGTTGFIGSTNLGDINVIGGNGDGILLNGSDGVTILQNFIGISPNLGFASIPNVTGINITNNGSSTHMIGNGSFMARNYICNNSSMGMYMENAPNHTIMGNFIGIKPDNSLAGNGTRGIHLVGATTDGNDILGNIIGGHSVAGIDVNGTNGAGNISGNKIGTDSTGMLARPNAIGVQIAATPINSQIIQNLISGNTSSGIFLDGSNTTINDNFIGTAMDTVSVLANGSNGIQMLNTNNSNIFNNIIAGNGTNGILLGACNANWIHGNSIGTNRSGMNLGNQLHGITLFFVSSNNMIGGPAAADHNDIMFNLGAGVSIEREVSTTGIRGNHFAQNAAHGISLYPAVGVGVVLPNDINDTDVSGPAGPNVGNNGQNTPTITSAIFNAGTCTVTGTMNVDNVSDNYLIQIYKVNPGNIDPTGHGEGDTLIAVQTFNAGGLNTFNFSMNITGPVIGDVLSVTTSKIVSTNFETSEFSDTIMVRAPYLASIIDSTDVLCNGAADGRLEVSVSGGTNPPYTFQWYLVGSGPIAGATSAIYFTGPGTYVCEVTDAVSVVVFSDTATIIEPPVLSVTCAPTNASCFGTCDGSIIITESGGTGPFQYSIDNGSTFQGSNTFNSLCASGSPYNFVVQDANSCLSPTSGNVVNIFEPGIISASPIITNETCDGFNDGAVTINAGGGMAPLNFQVDGGGFGASNIFTSLTDGVHSYDVLDANGCNFSSNFTILQGTIVTAAFTATADCEGVLIPVNDASTSSGVPITSWSWTFSAGSPSSSTIQNNPVQWFVNGSQTINLTVITANGCTATTSGSVTIFDNPVVDAGIDSAICQGTPFTQVATIIGGTSPFSFNWNPAGNFITNTIEDPTVTAAVNSTTGTYNHTLAVSDVNGCMGTDLMVLTVNSLPTVNAGNDNSICSGSAFTLSGSGSAISYTWDNSVVDGTPFNPTSTLTYTVTGTDGNGCQNTDQVTITTLISPIANAGIDATICIGQSYTLDGSASTGTITAYQWDEVGGITLSNAVTANVSPSVSTAYALTVDNGSCNDFDTVLITTISAPDPTFNYSSSTFCTNSADELPAFIATAGGTFSMPLSPGSINFTTGNINFVTLSAGNYSVIYTITTPCFASDTISLTIFDIPIVNAGNDTSFCAGGTVNLNGTGIGANFNWSNIAGFNTNTNPTSDTPASTDTYTFTVLDANGCYNSDTKLVTVNPIPTGTITGGGAFCEGDPNASLIVTANGYSGGGDWNNQFFQNSSPGAIATPSTGTYTLLGLSTTASNGVWTAVITDNITGCVGNASGSVTIFVNPEPAMSVSSPFNVCSSVGSFDMNTFFGPTIGGGTWSGSGVSGTNFNPFSIGAGIFNVVYTVASGCDDTVQINVQAAPNPTISGLNSAYCITDAPFMPTGTPAGGLWSIDGAPFTSITNIDPSTLSTGTHTLSYQFTDGVTGCVGTTNPNAFVVSPLPLDPTAVSNTTQSICGGSSLLLTVSNPNTGGTTIQWYSDSALTINVGSTINFTTPVLTGSIVYYAVAQNAGCKSNPVIFTITVNNTQVSAGADLTVCPGTPAQLNLISVAGTISWSPGISLNDSTIQNPIATPNVNTTYVVTVTSGPCSSQDSVNVIIDGSNPDCGIVPSYNAFSPDGDGINDVWIIDAILSHPDNRVTIYNRWGDKLVSFDDYDNVNVVWDGKYKGEMLPSGTYFYVIEYLDIQMQVSGWLQLTR